MEQKEKQTWVRQPQEQDGDYFFNGKVFVTSNVHQELSENELKEILIDLFCFIKQQNGCDYLQIYKHEDGRKIYVIDQLSKSMMDSDNYTHEEIQEYNSCTVLFNWEY